MATKQTGAATAKPAQRRSAVKSVAERRGDRRRGGAAPAPPVGPARFKVRALGMGFYGMKRRREGDVFMVKREDFSKKWMEPVDKSTPDHITGAQAALNKKHDEILGGTAARKKAEDADDDEGSGRAVTQDDNDDVKE